MKFNVGDKVRVRSWDDMASTNYLYDDSGEQSIWEAEECLSASFVSEMKFLCGREFTIIGLHPIDEDAYVFSWSGKIFNSYDVAGWAVDDWMLEKVGEEENLYFDIPTQVRFYESEDHELLGDEPQYGIAYKDRVVCACCGCAYFTRNVYDMVKLPWVSFRDEISEEG